MTFKTKVMSNTLAGKSLFFYLFGEDRKKLEQRIFGAEKTVGAETDINTKVFFRIMPTAIEVEVAV